MRPIRILLMRLSPKSRISGCPNKVFISTTSHCLSIPKRFARALRSLVFNGSRTSSCYPPTSSFHRVMCELILDASCRHWSSMARSPPIRSTYSIFLLPGSVPPINALRPRRWKERSSITGSIRLRACLSRRSRTGLSRGQEALSNWECF